MAEAVVDRNKVAKAGIPNGMPKTTAVSKEEEYRRRPERINEKTPSALLPLSSKLL